MFAEKVGTVEDAQRLAIYTSLRTINSVIRPPDGFGRKSSPVNLRSVNH